MIEVVFILADEFEGEPAGKGRKYTLVQPVEVDVDSETHYVVLSGVDEGQQIVTGSYRAISRELQHGTLVTVDAWFENGRHNKQFEKSEDNDNNKKND